MNAERIMDALNLLDDELIGEVDALRSRKAPKKPTPWRKLLPVAACFGLVLSVVLIWNNLEPHTDGTDAATVPESGVPEHIAGTENESSRFDGVTGGICSDDAVSVLPEASIPETDTDESDSLGTSEPPSGEGKGESTDTTVSEPPTEDGNGVTDGGPPESTDEVPSVILRIDSLFDGGFRGTVAEIVDTDFFSLGMEVTVEFWDDAFVGEISEGDRVLVMFNGFDDNTLYAEYVGRTTE